MLKFVLVGCGRISSKHFESIEQIEKAEIVACCDIIEERAIQAAQKYQISAHFTDYKEMLSKIDCDGVIICTPSGLHPQMGIIAAKRKLHIITEKPMATNLIESDKLIQACDKNGVQLFDKYDHIIAMIVHPVICFIEAIIEDDYLTGVNMINQPEKWTL